MSALSHPATVIQRSIAPPWGPRLGYAMFHVKHSSVQYLPSRAIAAAPATAPSEVAACGDGPGGASAQRKVMPSCGCGGEGCGTERVKLLADFYGETGDSVSSAPPAVRLGYAMFHVKHSSVQYRAAARGDGPARPVTAPCVAAACGEAPGAASARRGSCPPCGPRRQAWRGGARQASGGLPSRDRRPRRR
jgi:hypothetical protein